MNNYIEWILASVMFLGVMVLLSHQKVNILNPANPLALLLFVASLIINGFLWCEQWIVIRSRMIIGRIRRTKFRTLSSISIPERGFKVTS